MILKVDNKMRMMNEKKDQENISKKERTGNFSVQVVKYNYSCLISIHTKFYFKNVSVFPQVSLCLV